MFSRHSSVYPSGCLRLYIQSCPAPHRGRIETEFGTGRDAIGKGVWFFDRGRVGCTPTKPHGNLLPHYGILRRRTTQHSGAIRNIRLASGLAGIIVDELLKKYRPDDIISRVELRSKLSKVTMKANEDPRTLFNQVASIQTAYNNAARKIDQDDLTAVVLEKAPGKYKSIEEIYFRLDAT
jgi:hypothetical protein